MWLIILTSRQHIHQRDVANYTDDKTYIKEMSQIIRTTRQQDIATMSYVANYTDDNTYNKEMWLIIRTTRQDIQQRVVANYTDVKTTHTPKRCG